ncbi:unannotated protein [freshwater metagenome]|uniref:Unannotated protein n=1 Tax=freshwater metagenome TaxID=449393 RepID=A0A6J6P3G0_9ZZZZ
MITLTPPIKLDALIANKDLPLHSAGNLIPRSDRRPLIGAPIRDEVQLKPEGNNLTTRIVIHLCGVVQRQAKGFKIDRHVLIWHLDHMISPEPLVSQFKRTRRLGHGNLMLDHRYEGTVRTNQASPVPDSVQVGVKADSSVPTQGQIIIEPVHVIGLIPQFRGVRKMALFITRIRSAHLQSLSGVASKRCPDRPRCPDLIGSLHREQLRSGN